MFRRTRSDTTVGSIEDRYGINLHVRRDTLLGNLLERRGFNSLSQLLQAYQGNLTYHAKRRRMFLSFHAEDRSQVNGFRLMANNPNLDLDFYDGSLTTAIDSEQSSYLKKVLRPMISRVAVVVCLIGNGTAWRDWVDWELETGIELGKGLCGVRLKGSRGRTPPVLARVGAPVARWDVEEIVAVVECAAARRS